MHTNSEIIRMLQEIDARISVSGDDLKIDFKQGALTDHLKSLIRQNKKSLVEYIRASAAEKNLFVPVVATTGSYPLSFGQRKLWTASQFGGNVAYNLPAIYSIKGKLNLPALEQALTNLIERHEVLRTSFQEDQNNEVKQVISDDGHNSVFEFTNLISESDQTALVESIIKESILKPFDLISGPLIRFRLLKITADRYIFICVIHHIISDGWSMNVIIKDILSLYDQNITHTKASFPELRIQYKDFASWQQTRYLSDDLEKDKQYWLHQLGGDLPLTSFRPDMKRPKVKTYNGGNFQKKIDNSVAALFRQVTHEEGSTLFMGLLTVVKVLLYKYTNKTDLIVGCPIAGRDNPELINQIGFYVNTLPLRTQFNSADNFKTLLQKVKKTTLEAYDHQAYPYEEITSELSYSGNKTNRHLFDIMVALQNEDNSISNHFNNQIRDISITPYNIGSNSGLIFSKFDLVFNFVECDNGYLVSIEYNSDIFYKETIARLASHLEQILFSVTTNPTVPLYSLPYLKETEKLQFLNDFNNTKREYPKDKTLTALFQAQAISHPDSIAVEYKDERITYRDFNLRSGQFAHYLKTRCNVKSNMHVGIGLHRGLEMIISIVGVLKAGAAYVPVNPDYPEERINYLLSECDFFIDNTEWNKYLKVSENYSNEETHASTQPGDLAYVIYTSGTTGNPKGVMVKHRNVVRLVKNSNYISINNSDTILSLSNFSFDGSIFDIFGSLLNGARLIIPPQEVISDPAALNEIISTSGVTMFFVTTALFNALVDEGLSDVSKLKCVLFGGEQVSVGHVEKFKRQYPSVRLVHVYGPTENTTFSTFYEIDAISEDAITIPIGQGISNTYCYILNEQLELQPIGVAGELYVSGEGLSQGYLNNPELTASKFLENPFEKGEKMYKTGDIARWLATGQIEFIGRHDDQVKIRGFRVELGEVEQSLKSHPQISEAIVVAQKVFGTEKELIAYFVPAGTLDVTEIRKFMNQQLPEFMIPSYFIQVDSFHLNSNGKVDKKALPEITSSILNTGVEYISPRNETEKVLASIWSEVLSVDENKIGIKDDFFLLGGHSLKATRLSSQISTHFKVKVQLRDLFKYTVLEDQAYLIGKSKDILDDKIPAAPEQQYYPLSPGQRRLWALSQSKEGNIAYSIPAFYLFTGQLDRDTLNHCLKIMVMRHESLRTCFKVDDTGQIGQCIEKFDQDRFAIHYEDLRKLDSQEVYINDLIQRESLRPFDLSEVALFRAYLWQVDESKYVFGYVIHHIISDGWSIDLMIRELMTLYNRVISGKSDTLPELSTQYKDYSNWQINQLESSNSSAHKDYWIQQFSGELKTLELHTDKPRGTVKSYTGNSSSVVIDEAMAVKLDIITRNAGGTFFMGLVAIVDVLLYRYSGQEDITLGTPIAGRYHPDLEDQIGLYINTLALRVRFAGNDTFEKLLHAVKEVTLGAYEHQQYPFDELVKSLPYTPDNSRNPLFDVMVVLQNTSIGDRLKTSGFDNISVTPYSYPKRRISMFDLSLTFVRSIDGLHVNITHSELFNSDTINRLLQNFVSLFDAVTRFPDVPIKALDYLSEDEKEKLLCDFAHAKTPYSSEGSIIDLFEIQADRNPDKIAIRLGKVAITYRQLEERSNQLAHHLRDNYRLKEGDLVGVVLNRSSLMIISILGILKSGYAYLPIDPHFPDNKKEQIIRDSRCSLVITEIEYSYALSLTDAELFLIDIQIDQVTAEESIKRIGCSIQPTDLAYVMYTSGSTGNPKGVMVEHRGVVRLVSNINYVAIQESDVYLSLSNFSFDGSVFDIFCPLLNGCSVVIPTRQELLDPDKLNKIIEDHDVTIFFITTAFFNALADLDLSGFGKLRYILFGGEKVSVKHVKKVKTRWPAINLVHVYGPTENTTFSTYYTVDTVDESALTIPIGVPISNSEVYIFDSDMNLLPIGAMGEIFVGGDGLARGYLNNEALTLEKFVANPFSAAHRLYRTGDLGKRLADGNIEFIRRNDTQIKIRGYRIEPGEIERAILQCNDVKQAFVVAKSNAENERHLVAYYTANEEISNGVLRSDLMKVLPFYMLPRTFIRVPFLPLNQNGKVDVKQLPEPKELSETSNYAPASTVTEEILIQIWQEILHRQDVGINHNFFDVGGDSIQAIRVIVQANKVLHKSIEVKDIFQHQTIASLALYIDEVGVAGLKEEVDLIAKKIDALRSSIVNDSHLRIKLPENWSDVFPMSEIQKGMIYLSAIHSGSGIYHDQLFMCIKDATFDFERYRKSFLLLTDKHDILRTSFDLTTFSEPIQIVHNSTRQDVRLENLLFQEMDWQSYIRDFMRKDLDSPFNLKEAGLWRITVFKLSQEEFGILWSFHHAIMDGWSIASLQTELSNLYFQLQEAPDFIPKPLSASYKEYIIDQLTVAEDQSVNQFWTGYLSNWSRTALPLHKKAHIAREMLFKSYSLTINPELGNLLSKLSSNLKIHVKEIFAAAFSYFLKVTSNSEDVLFGIVTHGRSGGEDSDKVIGCFLNTIPFRQKISRDETVKSLCQKVADNVRLMKAFDKMPLSRIALCSTEIQSGENPFFDIIFNYLDFHIYNNIKNRVELMESSINDTTNTNTFFDFTIAKQNDDSYKLSINYLQSLYNEAEISGISENYIALLRAFTESKDHSLSSHDVFDFKLARQRGVCSVPYSRHLTLHAMFEEQALRRPESAAVICEGRILTYDDLNKQSNRLAHYLRAKYLIQPEDFIGVVAGRTERILICILGILKSGAAYIPIDPQLPAIRIKHFLEDSKLKALITDTQLPDGIETVEAIDDVFRKANEYSDQNLPSISSPTNLAYVMYTSGSTGNPKGVMVEHQSVVRLVSNINYVPIQNSDVYLSLSNFSFDGSVFDIFCPLLNGCSVVIPTRQELLDPDTLNKIIEDHNVTIFFITTAFFNAMADLDLSGFEKLRYILFGGEKVSVKHVKKVKARWPAINLVHVYGPTENTTFSTYYTVDTVDESALTIPIGVPISNSEAYIFDSSMNLLPDGVIGELYLGGDGLARGYLNNEALTNEKFVKHPFNIGKRLYRTGDYGRCQSDGSIIFEGRMDDQVKLRGYRIEMNEIEQALSSHELIEEAIVVIQGDTAQNNKLVAYYVSKAEPHNLEFRDYLSAKIPSYMLPDIYVPISKIPLTSNGKRDKLLLPPVDKMHFVNAFAFTAPKNPIEEKLVHIWSQVLERDIESIGTGNNFFEAGGNSLKAISLQKLINAEFDVNESIAMVFRFPTIVDQANYFSKELKTKDALEDSIQESMGVFESTISKISDDGN